ncbi:HalOD1 output domain-containing protein [Haloarcula sp. CBA1127]|uniref:HalOD1 output domain-containing protein n=1 Tax=Haloarcula sp. CBA1127 TaxID=1765055 RepID=UPI00073EA571|nr:HalOD1 output domain-containing protein [Haloarcula sp. CBA1127]
MIDDSQSDEADGNERLFAAASGILTEVQYDPTSDQELATVIVQAVTEQADAETHREAPLHDYIDVDAVETLLFGTQPDQSIGSASQSITFRYRNIIVTVRADGVIQLSDTDSSRARTN